MSLQYSTGVRNAKLDTVESTIGTSAHLVFLTGSVPANCAAAETGTRVAVLTLPSDWLAAASSGSKAKSGTWQDTSADNAGTISYFRIYDSGETTCHVQGTVTITGGGGDMTLDAVAVLAGQTVTVTTFTLTCGNA